jgi:hypothetical protein
VRYLLGLLVIAMLAPGTAVAASQMPFTLSLDEWRARCPITLTREDLKARGLKLMAVATPSPGWPKHAPSSARVVFDLRIDTTGTVVDIELERAVVSGATGLYPRGSVREAFVQESAATLRRWRFAPVAADGKPAGA